MLFIEFPSFTKAILKFPDDDYAVLQSELVAHPEQGDLIRGTGGFRKARMGFPSARIGKSGGARVIYLYLSDIQTIVLVKLYAKAKKSDLSKAEENELRVISAEIRGSLGSRKP
jgi:mRNA-degrading endonuclease RelE of RelBE toxin-antitoxin system